MEKMIANMESVDLAEFKLEKSIHGMVLLWNQFQKQMDSNNHSLKESMEEIELKEKELISAQESFIEQNKKRESTRDFVEEKLKELDEKDRKVNKRLNELALKEKQLGSYGQSIGRRVQLVESREKKVAAREEIVEGILAEFTAEGNQCDHVRKSSKKRFGEIDSKGNKLKRDSSAVDRFRSWTMKRLKALEAEEKEPTDGAVKFESTMKQIDMKAVKTCEKQ